MDIIKKIFSFNCNDDSAIGLCKFNDDFFKLAQAKQNAKERFRKEISITQMLKREY